MAFSRLGDDQKSFDVISELLSKPKAPPTAILLAARSLENLKREKEAIPLLERFLKSEPDAANVRVHLQKLRER